VLHQHESECPISGVDQPALLDVAHVRPWAEYPTYRGDIRNVLPLSKTHHAAFDNAVFTIDRDFRLRVNPEFDTDSALLQRTILDKTGEQLPLSASDIDPAHLAARNDEVGWI
jgi:Predicted restriction endonuclease